MKKKQTVSIVWIGITVFVGSISAADLAKEYPATLAYSKQPQGYTWTCKAKDVWKLANFSLTLDDQFKVQVGPSQVVFGCHGTNVLWAAVLPDEPGKITKASDGQDEQTTSLWLRFHPGRISELFPDDIVLGKGDAKIIKRAKVLAGYKMRTSWHAGGRPMVTPRNSTIVDMETKERSRRFFVIDNEKKTVEYIDAFRNRTVPVGKEVDADAALKVFDKVWNAFDMEYAMFAVKSDVDWPQLRDNYRPAAAKAKNSRELAHVISGMLEHLKDLHIYVRVDGDYVEGFSRNRPLNASVKALSHLLGTLEDAGTDIDYARTKDGIGYISVDGLRDSELADKFERVLYKMKDTRGLIIDLRFNGGGSEPLAQKVAGYFVDRERVYAKSQYRNGPKHSDLGPKHERKFKPNERWHYVGPVIVLHGQVTMSSAEAFVLMMRQCPNVFTLGDRTAGSSGNPRQIDAGAGIVVNLPRWIPMDADGKSFDTKGISPDAHIESSANDFTDEQDPVLGAALKRLRDSKPVGKTLRRRPD